MNNYIIVAKHKETGIHTCYTVKAKDFIAAIRDNEIKIMLQNETIVQITYIILARSIETQANYVYTVKAIDFTEAIKLNEKGIESLNQLIVQINLVRNG